MGGKGKGPGGPEKGGKGGPPAAPDGGGKGCGKAEIEAAKKANREEEKARLAGRKADEKSHMELLANLPQRKAALIDTVPWSTAKRQILLPGGTALVELDDSSIVCVRRAPQPAAEFIADQIRASLGVKAAKSRLVSPDAPEYKDIEAMEETTKSYFEDMPMTVADFIKELKELNGVNMANAGDLPTELKRPFIDKFQFTSPKKCEQHFGCAPMEGLSITVLEYLPGKGLDQCCGQLSDDGMRSLGWIAALDALFNQHDRVPLPTFRESGKLTNIMKMECDGAIIAVEQSISSMPLADFEGYLVRLKILAAQLTGINLVGVDMPAGYDITKQTTCDQLRELLSKSGFEVSDASLACYADGLTEALHKIAADWTSGALKGALEDAANAAKTAKIKQLSTATSVDECVHLVRAAADCLSQAMSQA